VQVAASIRSLVAFGSIVTVDPALLLRAVEVYEIERIDFAEAYLVAVRKARVSTQWRLSTDPSTVSGPSSEWNRQSSEEPVVGLR